MKDADRLRKPLQEWCDKKEARQKIPPGFF
jgi:hypothetical protein